MALTPVQPRTYLQLCQDLYREVGAAGGLPTSAIPTTQNCSGEILRLVNYVHDAELDIQNLWVDWKWLRKTLLCYTIGTINNQIATTQTGGISAYPTDLAEWDFKAFFIQNATVPYPYTSQPWQPLQVAEWQEVRNQVLDLVDLDKPWRVIVMPDNTLQFDLTPDVSYPLRMEYRAVPYDLKNDSDVSNIPARFANRLILEWARMKYGLFENAAEQVQMARAQIYGVVNDSGIMTMQGLLAQLENDQLPNAKNARLQQGNDIVIGGGQSSFDSGGSWGGSYNGYW